MRRVEQPMRHDERSDIDHANAHFFE